MHSTLINEISTNKLTCEKFLEFEEKFSAADSTNVLFFGLPNSGKTALIGSLITYLYNKNGLISTYDKHNMSVQSNKHFVFLLDYFNGVAGVSKISSTPEEQIFAIGIQLEDPKTERKEKFNFIDFSGVWTQEAPNFLEREQTTYTPQRNQFNSLQLELPVFKQSIFPDYITAILESSRRLEVFFVIESNISDNYEEVVKSWAAVVQAIEEYRQYVGFECNISIVLSKVDALTEKPNFNQLINRLRQQLPYALTEIKIFRAGLLDFPHRNKFTNVEEPNPYVLPIAQYLSQLV